MIDSFTKTPRPLRHVDVDFVIDQTQCAKCSDKPCLDSCPIDAVYMDESDGLIKLKSTCFGCVLCRNACPYDAISLDVKMDPPLKENVPNINTKLCKACGACKKLGRCIFNDAVNEAAPKFKEADGLVIASPVYYASANGTLVSFMDRLFQSAPIDKTMKVGASIAVARRGGCSATFDELNKYFTIAGMPVASSQYWNSVHGGAKGEAEQDIEGLQTMRTLARNMVFLMRSIELGKEKYGLPEKEEHAWTNFIR